MEIFFVESGRFAPCAIFPKTKQCLRAPRTTSERRVSLKPRHMDFFHGESGRPNRAIFSHMFRVALSMRLDFIKKYVIILKKGIFSKSEKKCVELLQN